MTDRALRGFRFQDVAGATLFEDGAPDLERLIKSNLAGRRTTHAAGLGGERFVIKIWTAGSLRQLLRCRRGATEIDREADLLQLTGEAGLPVPPLVGVGVRRRAGLAVARALVTRWLEHRVLLYDEVCRAARAGDDEAIARAARQCIDLMQRIRRGGFGDGDFGVHNLLLRGPGGDGDEVLWVDQQAAFAAAPDDDEATAVTVGRALASWWFAVRPHAEPVQRFFEDSVRALPAPRSGWPAIVGRVNESMHRQAVRMVEQGHAERPPAAVALGGAPARRAAAP